MPNQIFHLLHDEQIHFIDIMNPKGYLRLALIKGLIPQRNKSDLFTVPNK